MKQFVYDTPAVVNWMAGKMKYPVSWPEVVAIGLEKDGELVAGVAFENCGLADINMHVASEGKNWLTRDYLVRCFYYPFVELGLRRVTGLIPKKNERSLRFATGLGFRIEGVARHALPDDDVVITGMLKEECRFIPGYRHEQTR